TSSMPSSHPLGMRTPFSVTFVLMARSCMKIVCIILPHNTVGNGFSPWGTLEELSHETCVGVARSPACQALQHPSGRPLHEEVHAFVFNWGKAQAFVEPQGRVELLHMDAHGLVGGGGFGQEVAQDGAADAGVAVGWQQGDVDNADFVLPAGDVE